jgi:DNA polymerase III subunit delta'
MTAAMRFDAVIGQERTKELLQRATDQGRLGHSYLFSGPDGVGKTLLALELAKSLLCRGAGERPCGECRDCRMMEHESHPDLMLVQALEDKRLIGIEQARALGHFLTIMPFQSERRVAVIREAENLTDEAANSLLKTFEEPASFALLILTTSRVQSLLPTVRSRAQEVRFSPLTPAQIRQILGSRPDLTEEEIAFASRFANGSAGRAFAILDAGGREIFHEVIAPLLADGRGDIFEMSDMVSDWARAAGGKTLEPQRERVREFLRLLSCAWRDLLVSRAGAEELLFMPEQAAQWAARPGAPGMGGILRVEEAVWNARQMIDSNVTMGLALQELFERIARIQRAA